MLCRRHSTQNIITVNNAVLLNCFRLKDRPLPLPATLHLMDSGQSEEWNNTYVSPPRFFRRGLHAVSQ